VRPLARQATPATTTCIDHLQLTWADLDASLIDVLTQQGFPVGHLTHESAE